MKNETKGIAPLIIAIVVIVVAASVGVGAYVVTRGGGGGTGGDGGVDIGSATNLSFDITDTSTGMALAFKAKDIGSSSMKLRMEGTYTGYEFACILNGALSKCWVGTGGQWIDMSDTLFQSYWDTFSTAFSGYQTDLGSWTGSGSQTVGTVTISNISTETLADSLFADPT